MSSIKYSRHTVCGIVKLGTCLNVLDFSNVLVKWLQLKGSFSSTSSSRDVRVSFVFQPHAQRRLTRRLSAQPFEMHSLKQKWAEGDLTRGCGEKRHEKTTTKQKENARKQKRPIKSTQNQHQTAVKQPFPLKKHQSTPATVWLYYSIGFRCRSSRRRDKQPY